MGDLDPRLMHGSLSPVNFREHKFFTADISHTLYHRVTKFGMVRGLDNRRVFLEFRELWGPGGSTIPCDDML